MPNNTMAIIADQLADLYKSVKGIEIELSHQEADLVPHILRLAGEGWEGKNEEQRKLDREKKIAGDETCKFIQARITELRVDLADAEGEIEALREQRDALRWQTRERLATALEAKYGVTPAPTHEPMDAGFEVEADADIEELSLEQSVPDDEQIPF